MKGQDVTVAPKNGLAALFAPTSIAVVGASADSGRVGGRTLELLQEFGYAGDVYPISRQGGEMFGWQTHARIADVNAPIDLAVLCVNQDNVLQAARECAEAGVRALVIYSTFTGDDAEQQLDELLKIARSHSMRILGPNTVGSRGVVHDGVFATFSHDVEAGITPGSVAILAQSGGLGTYFGSSYLRRVGAGSRYVVDTGSEVDIGVTELIDYVSRDPEVSCIGVIIEGSRDGRALVASIADSVARGVPVVVYKTGRTEAAVAGIQSHTGAIAGDAQLFESSARDVGAVVAQDERDFVDAVRLLDSGIRPKGRRVGILTPSGGFGIIATDAASAEALDLPAPVVPPTPEELAYLESGDLVNPYDFTSRTGSAPDVLKYSSHWMSRQEVDILVIWQAHLLYLEAYRERLLDAIASLRTVSHIPVIVCGIAPEELDKDLAQYGVIRMEEPTRMMRAIGLVAPPAHDSPPVESESENQDVGKAANTPSNAMIGEEGRNALSFVSHVETVRVDSAAEALELATARSWTKILFKVESNDAPHKSELGLVVGPLSLSGAHESFSQISAARDAAKLDSPVVMQPCLHGTEIALGAFRDPMMGPSVLVALGGIHIEILKDFASAAAPVSRKKAHELIRSLKSRDILFGARGMPFADVDALVDVIVGLSEYIMREDDWQSIDLNPVFVGARGDGVIAADALIVREAQIG